MDGEHLQGAFADPALGAARAFRRIMAAMARPGTIHTVEGVAPPAPMSQAAGAVLLTLCDADTPLHLAGAVDNPETRAWLAFHTGAPRAGPGQCLFATGTWSDLGPLGAYPAGTPEYPDRSATLIVEMADLSASGSALRGPGIRNTAGLSVPDPRALRANAARYPLGLDFILTSGARLAAVPRSTEVM